jgi:hypothetical protein
MDIQSNSVMLSLDGKRWFGTLPSGLIGESGDFDCLVEYPLLCGWEEVALRDWWIASDPYLA